MVHMHAIAPRPLVSIEASLTSSFCLADTTTVLCCAGKNLECLTIDVWLVTNLSLVLSVWCLVL